MRPVLLSLLVVLLVALGARGQESPSAEALVQRLGDPEPAVREAAAVALRKLDRAAIVHLEAGLKSPDAEIRRVCADLLEAIRTDRGPRVEAFLAGTDPKDEPFPGWAAFKERAGDDRVARLAYYEMYQRDRALFEKLQKNPKQVAGQAAELCTALWGRGGRPRQGQTRADHVYMALLAASLEPKLEQTAFNAFTTMLYQPDVRELIAADLVARRLATCVLTARADDDPNQLLQTAYLANNLRLTEYIHATLHPAAIKAIESLGEKPDPNKVNQLVQLAQAAGLKQVLLPRLAPAVRRLAETAARAVEDGTAFSNTNVFYQATYTCQTLQLTDIRDEILKPAVLKLVQKTSERPSDPNSFYQAINLARNLQLDAEMTQALQPAVCRLIAEAAEHPEDDNRFNTALNLARMLNLNEAIDGALRPAARRRVLAVIEQPGNIGRLSQVIYQARSLELGDLVEDTLKPVFARQAKALLEKPDFSQIQQCYYLAQNLGGNTIIEDTIKPALRKLLKDSAAKTNNASTLQQEFSLAKQMGLAVEALPVARKAALMKGLAGYARGQAILTVIEFGKPEDLAALEPLLTDTTTIGNMGVNRLTLKAEVRDVVLGGLVFKAGKQLGDFGFPYYKIIPQMRPFDTAPSSLGFANNEERQAVMKKWEKLKAEMKNEKPEGQP